LEVVVRALDRLDCWRGALGQLAAGPGPNLALGSALLSCWEQWGFHIASSLRGDLILVDAFRRLLPRYTGPGLRLYRGELAERFHERTYGVAWTSDLPVAQMFANRRSFLNEGNGVVLEIDATPDMILAIISGLSESEYIIDPRLIQVVRVRD